MVWMILAGLIFGLGAVLLVAMGNPGNYGFCAACHLRDVAGALGLHQAATLQYARPEILGIVLGASLLALGQREFRPRGGSRPVVRFFLGMMMMIGALAFLGCPLRGLLRLAGGDLNGLTGLAGFAAGIGGGIWFLRRGYNLGRSRLLTTNAARAGAYALPAAAAVLAALVFAGGAGVLAFSVKGPGSMHAPVLMSLVFGLAAGAAAQKTRMCLSGGVRDFLLVRETYLLKLYGVLFLAALGGNLAFGFFKLGFAAQPLAHSWHVWNFLGLFLVGLAATLAGGCPLRQLIQTGEGNLDAACCVLGMLAGAAVAHGLNTAGSPAGLAWNGQVAVTAGLVATLAVGYWHRADAA